MHASPMQSLLLSSACTAPLHDPEQEQMLPRYVVPLVFWTMHRRWTTKRPAQEDWPHRPLVQQEAEMAEVLVEHAQQAGTLMLCAACCIGAAGSPQGSTSPCNQAEPPCVARGHVAKAACSAGDSEHTPYSF